MSDLFQGRTMTYARQFQYDAGGAFTFTLPFQADSVKVWNYTSFADTGAEPVSVWFRGMPAGDAMQWQRIIADGGSAANLLLETTNGFTVADTSGGVTAYRSVISGVTQADPCVITTSAAHGLATDQVIRITDLGAVGPNATARGMDELNNNRYTVVVINSTSFSLKDVISGEAIDSTSFTAWVAGGRVVVETREIDNTTAYDYLPVVYKLTFGSAIFGGAADNDIFYFEAIKFGDFGDLGDLAALR